MGEAAPSGKELFKEIFLEKKCGADNKTHDAFFEWCSGYSKTIETRCKGITHSRGMDCIMKARYYPEDIDLQPPDFPSVPEGIIYSLTCPNDVQPSKSVTWPDTIEKFNDREDYLQYNLFCYQELYGVHSTPWWLILIIVLAALLMVGSAAALFWRYYLKKLLAKKASGVETQFTSEPITSSNYSKNRSMRGRKRKYNRPLGSSPPIFSRGTDIPKNSSSGSFSKSKRSGSLRQ